jgi:hypothetical protein
MIEFGLGEELSFRPKNQSQVRSRTIVFKMSRFPFRVIRQEYCVVLLQLAAAYREIPEVPNAV